MLTDVSTYFNTYSYFYNPSVLWIEEIRASEYFKLKTQNHKAST